MAATDHLGPQFDGLPPFRTASTLDDIRMGHLAHLKSLGEYDERRDRVVKSRPAGSRTR